ncbi:cation:dicarboxylase symporter family transporter [Salmonella enterica]|nr:cation:dicarboxylase symporter family transporter [Salmonella enterica]
MKTSLFKSLYFQVLTAIAIGILLGHYYPELGAQMKPLGDAFVKLIKMIIAPVIFCTVVTGIAGMESMKAVGRTGAVALLYFEIVSTIALIIGLIIVNVVQPGAGMNLDGTSIYLTMAAVFIAQATNSHMDIFHQITLLVVLLLSSKGAAGVTGSGFIVLAATISAVGHLPVAGLALILGIDRFMSEARALTNLVGNGVATVVVAKWVKELDHQKLDDVLNNRAPDGKTHEISS